MDKLINYINWRNEKFGGIKDITKNMGGGTSTYFQIGVIKIRISDHMKYGMDMVTICDYYFIVQANDTYIFIPNPSSDWQHRMHMKVVTYQEARKFIKSIHDYEIQNMKMSDWYQPFVKDVPEVEPPKEVNPVTERLNWDEFKTRFLTGKNEAYVKKIVNRIETLSYGTMKKGTFAEKFPYVIEGFNTMPTENYNTLIKKMEEEV